MSDANESAAEQPTAQPEVADTSPPQRPVEPEITLVLGQDFSKNIPIQIVPDSLPIRIVSDSGQE